MKQCSKCYEVKPLSSFYPQGKEAKCRPCVSEIRRETYRRHRNVVLLRVAKYRKENPEKIRDTKLRQAYGVGSDYFDAKLKEQGGVCAVCRRNVKSIWRGKETHMALDHDHTTKEPRGVLCIKCNRALGLLEDNHQSIINLADYIRKYKKVG